MQFSLLLILYLLKLNLIKMKIKLSTLRDTLLPKLMSGELSVEEVSLD